MFQRDDGVRDKPFKESNVCFTKQLTHNAGVSLFFSNSDLTYSDAVTILKNSIIVAFLHIITNLALIISNNSHF